MKPLVGSRSRCEAREGTERRRSKKLILVRCVREQSRKKKSSTEAPIKVLATGKLTIAHPH